MSSRSFEPSRRALLGGASALAAGAILSPAAAQGAAQAADLAGRSVLITGCSSGFGRLTALHLARLGATVIASMRNLDGGARPEARELVETAEREDLKLSVVEIDVVDDALVASGVAAAQDIAGGSLDVLVNNAGIGLGGPVEINDMAATQLIFDTNLFGYLRMARAVLPAMREKGEGLIFNVSSQLGRLVIPNIGMYCATKFGVEAMFESMAYELAPLGVEVTIVQPGGYPTRIWQNSARYMGPLLDRVSDERKTAYAAHLEAIQGMLQGGGSTDPMDVPRAIAEIMAMPAGTRPLRRPVHPNSEAMTAANAALAQIQAQVLSRGRYAAWHEAVTD